MKSYTEILRGLREDKDLKQSDIADLISTTQQQYSKYENGESELPLRALSTLADFYGVSADFLMGRTACREGVDALNKKVTTDYSTGAIMSDILSLGAKGRAFIIECIYLQKLKQAAEKKKDGPRQ